MSRRAGSSWVLAACAVVAWPVPAQAQTPARGELLYRNHCVECHTSTMHWRDQRLVTDWPSLLRQVNRWQGEARLNWSGEDILDVARYLDESIYRLRAGSPRAGAGTERPHPIPSSPGPANVERVS